MRTAKEIYYATSIHSNPSLAIQAVQDGIDEHTAHLIAALKEAKGELTRLRDVVGEVDYTYIDSTLTTINKALEGVK